MIFLDVETRSELNISDRRKDLPVVSTPVYCAHPSTELLCLSWAEDDKPAKGFSFRYENDHDDGLFGITKSGGDPRSKLDELADAAATNGPVIAHHAAFEMGIWEEKLVKDYGFPELELEDWRCTMAAAGHFGAPLGLKDAAAFLNLDVSKLDDSVMRKLCLPAAKWYSDPSVRKWAGTREDFKNLLIYCCQDVEVCRALYFACPKMESSGELRVWQVDQKINRRGIPTDRELVDACARKARLLRSNSGAELVELTGGRVSSPKQDKKILTWMASQGYTLPNAQQRTFEDFLTEHEGDLPEDVERLVEIRLGGAGAAETKFPAIQNRKSPDNRVRYCFVFYGARTGRWTARGVQPQNLKKPPKAFKDFKLIEDLLELSPTDPAFWEAAELFGNTREVLAALLRPAFCAPEGKTFVCLDYSAIEARITAWFAGEEGLLRDFAAGRDIYTDMARKINPHNVNRALGKAAVLGLGFGMGAATFLATCKAWRIPASKEDILRAVEVFRTSYPRIRAFWGQMTRAYRTAVQRPGVEIPCGRLTWRYLQDRDVLLLRLPSGRYLFYHRPRVTDRGDCRYWGRLGADEKGAIGEVRGWGGKWVENAVQATAADVQRHAICSLDKYLPEAPVVLHAHDEVLTEVEEGDAERVYPLQKSIMLSVPQWGADIPLDAAGWIGRRYRKD